MLKRVTNSKGHNLPVTQASDYTGKEKYETIVIPSTTQAAFGGYFVIDLKEQGIELKQLTLQWNLSAITTMVAGMYSCAQFIPSKIEIWQGGACQLNIYPEEQFIQSQLFERDEDRLLANVASGVYSSTAQRIAMAATASSYYHTLRDYVKCAGSTFILNEAHNIQLRVWVNPLASITTGTSGVAAASITSVNLLAKIRRLSEDERNYQMKALAKSPFSFKFNEVKQQTNQVVSGATSVVFTLPNLVGNISLVAFVVRPTTGLTGNSQFSFVPVASFEYLNASGTNMTGGSVVTASQCLVYSNDVSLSSYLSETAAGLVNNGASVFLYSFSADAVNDILTGTDAGVHKFTGAEQLRINFASALGSAHQIDIYAFNSKMLIMSRNGVKSVQA